MLPQKRTPALDMATEAVLVDRTLQQLARVRAAMRIVATGARNLALAIGHVRRALQLRSPHLVALQAQFRLRQFGAYVFGQGRAVARVDGSQLGIALGWAAVMNPVTVHASHRPRLVWATPPEHLITLGVAGQASRISFLDRSVGILGEADGDRILT